MMPAIQLSDRFLKQARALIVVVIAFIALIHILPFLPLPPIQLAENRVLAEYPSLPRNWLEASEFPSKFDKAAQDQLPGRAILISAINYLRYRLGYSGNSQLVEGKDGWIFYDGGSSLRIVRGVLPPTDDMKNFWLSGLMQRINRVRQAGIPLFLFVPPDKQSEYPEELPKGLTAVSRTQTDTYLDLARAHGFKNIVDVREPLRNHDAASEYYTPWDTHWTGNGAYIAYRALLEALNLPHVKPFPLDAFEPTYAYSPSRPHLGSRDLANMLGIGEYIHPNFPLFTAKKGPPGVPLETKTPEIHSYVTGYPGPVLLLIRDSFSDALIPFLIPHFSKIIYMLTEIDFPSAELLNRTKPDVVVMEIVERNLGSGMWPLKN
ncbi:hypothetical protein [uncultured Bradyrhizobium sp.]|jgi:hypothetical protein|uniref:alginate O-acetyltransferase AlgX-related protein n=1 Tax=uncultured Bradyrhizobium sp. TaxID=199684 RepID=UPI00260206E3|nr:hypothetical protein [uncultured Bradyrhizobium sp.]